MKFVHDVKTLRDQDTQTRIVNLIATVVIVASLGYFFYNFVIRGLDYEIDFLHFYSGGQIWHEGGNAYDETVFRSKLYSIAPNEVNTIPTRYLYPPQASVLFSLYGSLPIKEGNLVQLLGNTILYLLSIIMLAFILSWYHPIGLIELAVIILLMNTGYGRAVRIGQLSALTFVSILGTFICYCKRNAVAGGLFFSILSIKPAFIPLFGVYYLIRRQYKLLIVAVITSVVITFLPLILTGRSVTEFVTGFADMITGGSDLNDPSPSVPFSATLNNLQPIVFRITNSSALPSSLLSWGLIAGMTVYAFYLMLRTPETPRSQFLDFALICALSMIFIYRRNYDMFLMFPAVLYIYLHICDLTTWRQRAGWVILLAISAVVMYLPADLSLKFLSIRPTLNDNYLFRVIAPFQAWINVFLLLGILWIKRQAARKSVSPTLKVIPQPSVVI